METITLPSGIGEKSISHLKKEIKGSVLLPYTGGYNKARVAWNLTIDQYPALIVEAENTTDVVKAVKFAEEHNLRIAVQSTGHGVIYPCDGQMLIRTSEMDEVIIIAEEKKARIEAGALWSDVVRVAQRQGLAPLSGFAPSVGVVGYTLSGGFGWLLRKYGLAVDSLLSVDMVTMQGEILHVTQASHPDLFGGLGGGGIMLGIITAIEIRLFPVEKVYTGKFYFPAEDAPSILPFYAGWTAGLPEEMTTVVNIGKLPYAPGIPISLMGKYTLTIEACYLGSEEEGLRLFQPIRDKKPAKEELTAMSPKKLSHFNGAPPGPQKEYQHVELFDELSTGFLNLWSDKLVNDPVAQTLLFELRHVGNGALSQPAHSSVFSHRETQFSLEIRTPVTEEKDFKKAVTDVTDFLTGFKKYASGHTFLSFLGYGDDINRVKAAFTDTNWKALQKLRQQFDPKERLMSYMNIPAEKSKDQ